MERREVRTYASSYFALWFLVLSSATVLPIATLDPAVVTID